MRRHLHISDKLSLPPEAVTSTFALRALGLVDYPRPGEVVASGLLWLEQE